MRPLGSVRRQRRRFTPAGRIERLRQIAQQVVGMFKPDRQAHAGGSLVLGRSGSADRACRG